MTTTLLETTATVHVVDDDPLFVGGVSLLLRSQGYTVNHYSCGERFLECYRPEKSECLLIDLRMPGLDGLDVLSELKRRRIRVPILIVTAFAETPCVVAAIKNGALDVIEKPVEKSVLLSKIESALSQDRTKRARIAETNLRISALTQREREVLELLYAAKTTHAIAGALTISPKTVEKHRIHIFEKLRVDNVPELMKMMFERECSPVRDANHATI